MKIQVTLVDDLDYVRKDIPLFLNSIEDINCGETYKRAEDFYDSFLRDSDCYMPDVVLMDFDFNKTNGKMSGIECVRLVREKFPKAKTKFIMFTVFQSDELVFSAMQAGAIGYIMKNDRDNLANGIRTVANNGGLMSSNIVKLVMNSFHRKEQQKTNLLSKAGLTEREHQVLDCLAKGLSYKKIAKELVVEVNTVNSHIKHIYEKLQVNSRNEVIKMLGFV